MAAHDTIEGAPPEFSDAVDRLRDAVVRPEVTCESMPPPRRIAPYTYAQSGDVVVRGDEVGTGRLVLLHDPDGNDAWQGTFRLVMFARADVDAEMAGDPAMAGVGWSWLVEALTDNGAEHIAASGSVTIVRTEGFGGMAEDGSTAQLEIRASWSPTDVPALEPHAAAWADLLCTVAGLPPLAHGVLALPPRGRERRGR